MERRRFVSGEEPQGDEKQPGLPFVEVAHRTDDRRQIVLLLAERGRRRVLTRRREVGTIARAGDFHESLRAAADGADLVAQRRTRAAGLALPTEGTNHGWLILYDRAEILE